MENALEVVTKDKIIEYLQAFGLAGELTKPEVTQFVEVAQAYNLNPFKREIYCITYGQGDKRKLSIIVGYESYIKRAERTGKLKGWKAWTEGSFEVEEKIEKRPAKGGGTYDKLVKRVFGDMVAKVVIYRDGWDMPFEHEVSLDEYAQDNEMWGGKPRTMLKKVAIAQAFRLAFSDEMGGMPYTEDELPAKPATEPEMRNVTPEPEDAPETDQDKSKRLAREVKIGGGTIKQLFPDEPRDYAKVCDFLDLVREADKTEAWVLGVWNTNEHKLSAVEGELKKEIAAARGGAA